MDEKRLGEKIRERRKLLKLTQGQLAKAMLVSTDYISRIEKGERTPSERVQLDLDDFLAGRGRFAELEVGRETTVRQRGANDQPHRVIGIRDIPVLGRISAGFPNLAVQEVIEYIAIPGTPENSFALVVKGASMEPAFRDGDYVIFIENGEYKNNDVLIVLDEWGDAMIKRLKEREGKRYLVSDNPTYPVIEPNEYFRIIGRVVKGWRDIKF